MRKQVRLAQRELEDKNYGAAVSEAEGALKLAPGHPDAEAVLAVARGRASELDRAVEDARRLLAAADTEGASRELSRLLELDPRHPAAAELSAGLNSVFRAQADAAAASMRASRAAALSAGAGDDALRAAVEGAGQADALMARGRVRGRHADVPRGPRRLRPRAPRRRPAWSVGGPGRNGRHPAGAGRRARPCARPHVGPHAKAHRSRRPGGRPAAHPGGGSAPARPRTGVHGGGDVGGDTFGRRDRGLRQR